MWNWFHKKISRSNHFDKKTYIENFEISQINVNVLKFLSKENTGTYVILIFLIIKLLYLNFYILKLRIIKHITSEFMIWIRNLK
jgi:hypothetical protein